MTVVKAVIVGILVGSLALVAPTASLAGDGMKFFPIWERKQCGTEEFACYTKDQAKAILQVDLDMQLCTKELDLTRKNVGDLKAAVTNLEQANTKLVEVNAILDQRLTEKHKVLEETSLAYQRAERRDILGGGLPWLLSISVVCLLGGFVGGYLLRNAN